MLGVIVYYKLAYNLVKFKCIGKNNNGELNSAENKFVVEANASV